MTTLETDVASDLGDVNMNTTEKNPEASRLDAHADQSFALVHDWCPSFRGGERVLAQFCQLYPHGEVFTLFDFLSEEIKNQFFPDIQFHTSPLNRLFKVQKYYRALFFACPFFMEQFDVTDFDVVISSSAAYARGIITRPDQPHLCYVHSPVRYAWDEQFSYLKQARMGYGPMGFLFRYLLHRLRKWDVRTAHGPDLMLANSSYVRQRIRRIYGRDARVVFPPVTLDEMIFRDQKEDYYITASFLAPYKRTDLVIQAFNNMPSRRLLVVGEGQQTGHLRALANSNVEFSGFLPRRDYVEAVANARALVFAGCEDFGIALAEAQACGTPLIAFGRGGACDIVRTSQETDKPTGLLFTKQTASAIKDAVEYFEEREASKISLEACQKNAQRFSEKRFRQEIAKAVDDVIAGH
jgi:glycosyltransferase involved in cell wall biosynthesis